MAFHRIADADAADQECRQSDDGKELREALDVALKLRRSVAAVTDIPTGFGKLRARLHCYRFGRGIGGLARRQAQPIMPAHQTARLQQAGGAQSVLGDQQARSETDAAGELVRFARQRSADFDRGAANGQPRARLDAEPRQQDRIRRRAEDAVAQRQRVAECAGRIEYRLSK